jgi:Domain of unknown function (DUF6894)
MARYFFHFSGTRPVEDDEGEEFPTREAAIAAGSEVARDLGAHRHPSETIGWVLRVTDETGAEIASFPISTLRSLVS